MPGNNWTKKRFDCPDCDWKGSRKALRLHNQRKHPLPLPVQRVQSRYEIEADWRYASKY